MDLAAFFLAGVALVVAVFASLEARRANDRIDAPGPTVEGPPRSWSAAMKRAHLRRVK